MYRYWCTGADAVVVLVGTVDVFQLVAGTAGIAAAVLPDAAGAGTAGTAGAWEPAGSCGTSTSRPVYHSVRWLRLQL